MTTLIGESILGVGSHCPVAITDVEFMQDMVFWVSLEIALHLMACRLFSTCPPTFHAIRVMEEYDPRRFNIMVGLPEPSRADIVSQANRPGVPEKLGRLYQLWRVLV